MLDRSVVEVFKEIKRHRKFEPAHEKNSNAFEIINDVKDFLKKCECIKDVFEFLIKKWKS
ncbi:hypothetical protein EDEG_02311 [Edhazardia aedis USNM 41457]|uniref:Uncharacterized protein n=1 Tax=Edhazardia aedis (strain USNM 41457) TaxID=1003232 RepID=J9D742_EDHAE|nr:hypothetical protein EDEG_02311 [Edhazardia aedis USNM 41457]|eukprot:EJW03354.1 hypothetical protein EDEG_02311 [Edhazardia aedis USNM 41457]